jgi:hypothetical protein
MFFFGQVSATLRTSQCTSLNNNVRACKLYSTISCSVFTKKPLEHCMSAQPPHDLRYLTKSALLCTHAPHPLAKYVGERTYPGFPSFKKPSEKKQNVQFQRGWAPFGPVIYVQLMGPRSN